MNFSRSIVPFLKSLLRSSVLSLSRSRYPLWLCDSVAELLAHCCVAFVAFVAVVLVSFVSFVSSGVSEYWSLFLFGRTHFFVSLVSLFSAVSVVSSVSCLRCLCVVSALSAAKHLLYSNP